MFSVQSNTRNSNMNIVLLTVVIALTVVLTFTIAPTIVAPKAAVIPVTGNQNAYVEYLQGEQTI